MTITTNKSNIYLILVMFILVLSVTFLLLILGGMIPAIILLVSTSVILSSYFITIGRIITMTESGCKVTFWKYTQEYSWNTILIKSMEPPHLGLRQTYHAGGAFFSVCPVRKPKWMDPTLYCVFCHPFSCFYVYFLPNGNSQETRTMPGIYEADKTMFLGQLKEWGITLD